MMTVCVLIVALQTDLDTLFNFRPHVSPPGSTVLGSRAALHSQQPGPASSQPSPAGGGGKLVPSSEGQSALGTRQGHAAPGTVPISLPKAHPSAYLERLVKLRAQGQQTEAVSSPVSSHSGPSPFVAPGHGSIEAGQGTGHSRVEAQGTGRQLIVEPGLQLLMRMAAPMQRQGTRLLFVSRDAADSARKAMVLDR